MPWRRWSRLGTVGGVKLVLFLGMMGLLTLWASSSATIRPALLRSSRKSSKQIVNSAQAAFSSTNGQLRSTIVSVPGWNFQASLNSFSWSLENFFRGLISTLLGPREFLSPARLFCCRTNAGFVGGNTFDVDAVRRKLSNSSRRSFIGPFSATDVSILINLKH